jgi:hypothetical protein
MPSNNHVAFGPLIHEHVDLELVHLGFDHLHDTFLSGLLDDVLVDETAFVELHYQ